MKMLGLVCSEDEEDCEEVPWDGEVARDEYPQRPEPSSPSAGVRMTGTPPWSLYCTSTVPLLPTAH